MRCLAAIGTLTLAATLGWLPERGLAQTSTVTGSETYRTYCAVCHGDKGRGDGPLAASLRSVPPDLSLLARTNGGEYPAETVAKIVDGREPITGHGGPDMPVWGDAFKQSNADEEAVQEKVQSVVAFVGRLQQK